MSHTEETVESSGAGRTQPEDTSHENESDRSGAGRAAVKSRRKTGDRCLQKPLPLVSNTELWKDDSAGVSCQMTRGRNAAPPEEKRGLSNGIRHDQASVSSELSTEYGEDMEELAKDIEKGSDGGLVGPEGSGKRRPVKHRLRSKSGAKEIVPIRLRRMKLSQKLQDWKEEEDLRIREALNRAKSSAIPKVSLAADPKRSPRNESFRSRKFSLPLLADSSKGSEVLRKVSDVRYRHDLRASPIFGGDSWVNTNRAAKLSPNTARRQNNRTAETLPKNEHGTSIPPNKNRLTSISPKAERSTSVSPKSNHGTSLSPNSSRETSNSPKSDKGTSSSPNSTRGTSISPNSNRMASASPTNDRASPDRERRVSSTSNPVLDLRVQDFLSKKQPKAPAPTLRTTDLKAHESRREGSHHSKPAPGPRRAVTESRMRGVVINTDTSPSLNEFQDRSWYYQDKSGKCRYLRVPESPPPPVSWVFEKDET